METLYQPESALLSIIIGTESRFQNLGIEWPLFRSFICIENEKISNDVGINLMFVRNNVIRKYNKDFLNKDNPTDVISFEGNIDKVLKGNRIPEPVKKIIRSAVYGN